MLCFILNKSRRLIQKFNGWPHWAKDIYGIISYINFLELIPTFAVITFHPRHFFRRLPLILKYKRPLYRTPIKFFSSAATLFTILFLARHDDLAILVGAQKALWYMLVLIPLTPFLMVSLALVLIIVFQLPRLIPGENSFDSSAPLLVVSLQTYKNLKLKLFFWGLLYFSIYFITSWQFAELALGYGVIVSVKLIEIFETDKGYVEGLIILITAVLLGLIVYWLVLRPYVDMLRMSLRCPTTLVFKSDVSDAGDTVNDFLIKAKNAGGGSKLTHDDVKHFLLGMQYSLASMEQTVRLQDKDYQHIKERDSYLQERVKVFISAFQQKKLHEVMNKVKDVSDETQAKIDALNSSIDGLTKA